MVTIKRRLRTVVPTPKKEFDPFDDSRTDYRGCVRKIEPRPCTAWIVELPDGSRKLLLWHASAQLEDVHHACCVTYPAGFRLGMMGVGQFDVKVEHSYRDDSRYVDQDWTVGITTSNPNKPFEDS